MSVKTFQCLDCQSIDLEKSEVVILICKHIYCWTCIGKYITSNLKLKIKCPSENCGVNIKDSVIRKAIPDSKVTYYENLSLRSIVNSRNNIFKCLLVDCDYICFIENNMQFECPQCTLFNCIACPGTHPLMSCKNYLELKSTAFVSNIDRIILQSMETDEFEKAKKELQKYRINQWKLQSEKQELFKAVPNDEAFTCSICLKVISKGVGIKLRNCFHTFCRDCLHSSIQSSVTIPVACLENMCKAKIEDREIQEILTKKEYNAYLDKSLVKAQASLSNVFHCKTPDCKYFGIHDDPTLKLFECPNCKCNNCTKCNAIHAKSETCSSYKLKISKSNVDTKSLDYINEEIKKGLCMKCPSCGVLIKKIGGCNWVKCPSCSLELCWVLKIPRWGPKGNGDISGGCKCGVNNVLCSKDCFHGCIPEH